MRWPRIDETSSWLAMDDVFVECQTPEDTEADLIMGGGTGVLAYVPGWRGPKGGWHPYPYAVFSAGICENFMSINSTYWEEYAIQDQAEALLVLTHEAGHMRGVWWSGDEARTECWAIRHVGYASDHIGVTDPIRRRELVSWAVWVHQTILGPNYHLPGCRLPPHDPVALLAGRGAPALPSRPVRLRF
jgi:hypothetical protein